MNEEGITYDNFGRMQYHPEFHPNHKKPITLGELIYISKFIESDGGKSISLALGRTENTVLRQLSLLRTSGRFERYKAMSEEEWEQLLERAEDNA